MTTIEIAQADALTAPHRPQWLVVHYRRDDAGYDDRVLYAWGDIDPAAVTDFPGGRAFAGEDAYGRFAWVRLAEGARDVGFLVADRAGAKDVAEDRHVDPAV
ncbi:pullulanase-associated domain-containing protein, partial [Couchioplanes caeruleus]